jgi:hypothetical protein
MGDSGADVLLKRQDRYIISHPVQLIKKIVNEAFGVSANNLKVHLVRRAYLEPSDKRIELNLKRRARTQAILHETLAHHT